MRLLTLIDNARLSISYTPGTTGGAIVSFSGIGFGIDGIQREEFVRSLEALGHDQFFVVDRTRTWFNATCSEVRDVIEPRLQKFERVTTLGNSMGGLAAVYFASQIERCYKAIAFAPQYSVDTRIVPQERRWEKLRRNIETWPLPHALHGARDDREYYLFFGDQGPDRYHMACFERSSIAGLSLFSIVGQSHRVAGYLRDRGVLANVIQCIVGESCGPSDVLELLRQADVAAKPVVVGRRRAPGPAAIVG